MKKYKVYLTTGNIIEVEGNVVERGTNHCIFYAAERVVAMFIYENICGWCIVEEFE